MALPKKIKKNINLTNPKTGFARREELVDIINENGTYLPKSILHADLDRGFLDFVKNDLEISTDSGKKVPVIDIIITTQNWAQFTQTWNFNDLDKNVLPPFVTTVRTPEVKYGTLPSLRWNIPNRKQYFYAAVPNFNNGRKGVDIYTIPQPVPVDIKYSVRIVCNRMRELNSFNKKVIETFASRQAYTVVKGNYIPIILDEIQDESVMDLEKRKLYIQTYNFTLQGFLIDENEFEVKPAVSRAFTIMEINTGKTRSKKPKVQPENINIIPFNINFPVSTTAFTYTFEYNSNLTQDGISNISNYDVYINNLYYGSNILSSTGNTIQVNTNDVLTINITKTNALDPSILQWTSKIV